MVKAEDGVVDSLNTSLQRIGTFRHLALLHRAAIEELEEDSVEDTPDRVLQVPSPGGLPLLRKMQHMPLQRCFSETSAVRSQGTLRPLASLVIRLFRTIAYRPCTRLCSLRFILLVFVPCAYTTIRGHGTPEQKAEGFVELCGPSNKIPRN